MVGYGISVFGVAGKTVVGALERDFEEANGGVRREGGAELLGVEWGVD